MYHIIRLDEKSSKDAQTFTDLRGDIADLANLVDSLTTEVKKTQDTMCIFDFQVSLLRVAAAKLDFDVELERSKRREIELDHELERQKRRDLEMEARRKELIEAKKVASTSMITTSQSLSQATSTTSLQSAAQPAQVLPEESAESPHVSTPRAVTPPRVVEILPPIPAEQPQWSKFDSPRPSIKVDDVKDVVKEVHSFNI